jgi:hypothetical protein
VKIGKNGSDIASQVFGVSIMVSGTQLASSVSHEG